MLSQDSGRIPVTEEANPRTESLSSLSSLDIVRLMNDEDATVAEAVRAVLPQIGLAVDRIVERLRNHGRLFYIGTGTSGRLGVLDAAEVPPTFGVSPELVQGVIAGGYEACYRAVEASEDDAEAGKHDLEARGFTKQDALVGIAASGHTPYTVGAVKYARDLGAFTAALTCAPESPITRVAEVPIIPLAGPEVIAGSTRLKAGTAQKMVLNMISTATMAQLGYVTGNRMTNVQTRNSKLHARAIRIIVAETDLDQETAAEALDAAEGNLPVALVMAKTGSSLTEAKQALEVSSGVVPTAIETLRAQGL